MLGLSRETGSQQCTRCRLKRLCLALELKLKVGVEELEQVCLHLFYLSRRRTRFQNLETQLLLQRTCKLTILLYP